MADAAPGADPQGMDEEVVVEEFDPSPVGCLLVSAGSFVSGGVLGGLVGTVGGVFKREGFKVALQEGASSAKTFALMSGVHSLVTCVLQRLRKKEDVLNQGVAGCASGIALGIGGPPSTMLVNCAGFAAFAFIYEFLSARTALASTLAHSGPGSPALGGRRGVSRTSSTRVLRGCALPQHRPTTLRELLSLAFPCQPL